MSPNFLSRHQYILLPHRSIISLHSLGQSCLWHINELFISLDKKVPTKNTRPLLPRHKGWVILVAEYDSSHDYTGPSYYEDPTDEMQDIVPIFRSSHEYVAGNKLCARSAEFPTLVTATSDTNRWKLSQARFHRERYQTCLRHYHWIIRLSVNMATYRAEHIIKVQLWYNILSDYFGYKGDQISLKIRFMYNGASQALKMSDYSDEGGLQE
ncbi:uncharacterized protein B0J16DRAFT_391025 [Fusarium flagelliforme]|uniref:uncharacterized protein n=1 Tax=Fusarium flagelliforme TaxID=2675880 RepID=UPI001E8E1FF6|nr:uncharacterized protein B0J16DRAFT_391025 [Fusarium flagelliforme]KAH7197251.1 hypothetical protein B0J16DRAFT_391025 [Fusarium flagelliforme]